jgi:hypothetical protein
MIRLFNGDGVYRAGDHAVVAAETSPTLFIMRLFILTHFPGTEETVFHA